MQLGFRSLDGKFIRDKIAGSVAGPILTRPGKAIMDSATGKIRGTPAMAIGYIPMPLASVSMRRRRGPQNRSGYPTRGGHPAPCRKAAPRARPHYQPDVNTSGLRLARGLSTALTVLLAGLSLPAQAHLRAPSFIFTLAQMSANTPAATNANAADSIRAPERAFLLQGLETSRQEAELSRLAVGQASSSEVREFAQQLATDYQQINQALETLARRKAVEVPLQPTSFSDQYRALAARSGAAFDRAFIREIAGTNARALRLCESAVGNARDPDIRELAGSLLPVVRDHVNKTTDLEKSL
jgi:putative membrane protein